MDIDNIRNNFYARLSQPFLFFEELLDNFTDIAFVVKDRQGKFISVSKTFMFRVRRSFKSDVIGRTVFDLFPREMAERYHKQDQQVFTTGLPITDNLDLTIYVDGTHGWCQTCKVPLFDKENEIIGLACISKDIHMTTEDGWVNENFAKVVDFIIEHRNSPLNITKLAKMSCLTPAQFERRVKKIFHMSPGQFILKTKMDAALQMLKYTDKSISEISFDSGFCDQSAMTRRFKMMIGQTPKEFRDRFKAEKGIS